MARTPTGGARGRATPARPGDATRTDTRTGRGDQTGRAGTARNRAGGTPPPPGRGGRGSGTGPAGRPDGAGRRRTRLTARGRRVLIFGVSFFVLVFGVVGVSAYVLVNKVTGNVSHLSDTFGGIDEKQRPAKPAAARNSLTFLLVGSDSRDNGPTTGKEATGAAFKPGAQRTDSIMLMHIPDDRKSAQVVSIPRDSWVDIPDHGKMKINAAYALGGPPLLIRTIEKLTGVRIDHFAIVDFYGFKSIIDAIGGIDIEIPRTTRDIGGSGRTFQKGMNHFDGAKALDYVRQRHGLPAGDFDRVKRQQNMIRAVMSKISKVDPTANPVQAYQLLDAMTKAITVDESLTESAMRSLAFGMRGVGAGGGVSFLTAPVTGTGTEGDQSVVYLDQAKTTELWNGMNNDTMAAYLTGHQNDLLPAVPR